MPLSILDLFSIGIGPSSSHTVGPMRAAHMFTQSLTDSDRILSTARVKTELFGSLAATGIGHGTDTAVVMGLLGLEPETLDPDYAPEQAKQAADSQRLSLAGEHPVDFSREQDVLLRLNESLPGHPNGMRLTAYDAAGDILDEREYYSVGGGFVLDAEDLEKVPAEATSAEPYPFESADELLAHCRNHSISIAQVMLANERTRHDESRLRTDLLRIWEVMQECVENGCTREDSILPGGLEVRRRAPRLRERLLSGDTAEATSSQDPLGAVEWVNLYALAVNEENASGGRVVTAPTNGAAGIIPAVLHYFTRFHAETADDDAVVDFLLTAGAIGMLFKLNASISGAEVGCQGEVGSACSMAAGALCAVLGGTPQQVENAAEIGLEHNLGLTCDPVGGLVQVPCIERNAIASVKAVNAARLALAGDGTHRVTLDQAIKTMRETGADMKSKYKETSLGGLAVNVIAC